MRSISLAAGPARTGSLAAWFGASNAFMLGIILIGLTMVLVANVTRSGKAILDGKQGPEVTLARVLESFPLQWEEQPGHFGYE